MVEKKENRDVVKRRILELFKILQEQTDEEHPLDTYQLMEQLEEMGLPANRKTLKNDIESMIEAGFDVVVISSKPNKFFWGSREFELPELKLLVDAVSSSRFITQKKSRDLTRKLTEFASVNHRSELDRHVSATSRVKASNESIYYTVDTINEAINKRKMISFKYTEYDGAKKKVYRNDGEVYELSPYQLFWNEDFYYVVGYSEKHGNVSSFRVDRMEDPKITKKNVIRRPKGFSMTDFSKKTFDMFGGDEVDVRLECRNELMKYIIDRFGESVHTKKMNDEYFVAKVNVSLSPTFYAWVFQFAGQMRILSPERAVDEMKKMAQEIIDG